MCKQDPGPIGRKVFMVTVKTVNKFMECETSKTAWTKAKSGEFAQITIAWRHRIIQRLEPLAGLRPEEKIWLEKMLEASQCPGS